MGTAVSNLKVRAGPDGLHLFNRLNGLNILFDEIDVPVETWSSAPRQVSVALSNACDLHCPYCYAPKTPAKLYYDELIRWLHELDANGTVGVGFGGGEPMLYRNLPRLCQFAAEETRLAVTFTTHAQRLDEHLASRLVGNVHFIRVSMDGVGATYERLRGRGFEGFKQRLRLVRMICPFGINFVVNRDTLPDLDSAVSLAAEFEASELLLLPERATYAREGIDSATGAALLNWVKHTKRKVRLAISEGDAIGLPVCQPFPKERGLGSYAHIDAFGVLKRSSFTEQGVRIGAGRIMDALKQLKREAGEER
jgi:sulfatase maturation enzyme AslB (radical SAM superfamily)